MRALVLIPGEKDSVSLRKIPKPPLSAGPVLVKTLAVGVCGTDLEMNEGFYGEAPPEKNELILGHESLGEVVESPSGSFLKAGVLVVPMVRHADPLPCPSCARGEWDMCQNGLYTEHGIKGRDGFCVEFYRSSAERLIVVPSSLQKTGVLVEPASIVAKAWEQIDYILQRSYSDAKRVLITGAGPVGLLAALLARQRGFEVHLFDRIKEGAKPRLAQTLGAVYHTDSLQKLCGKMDIVLECTGVAEVIGQVFYCVNANGIVCLMGVSPKGRFSRIDLGGLNYEIVLQNKLIFGSVNANRRHYESAVQALSQADSSWLEGLITRRLPLSRWQEAFIPQAEGVKTIFDFSNPFEG